MRAKDYLLQVKKLNRIIINKNIEVMQWKDAATSISAYSEGERVQSSGNPQRMENAICNYIDLQEDICKDIMELEKKKQDIIKTIQQLEVTEYNVLHLLYIQYKDMAADESYTLYDVADIYKKSYPWATRIHGIALKKVQNIIDKEEAE